MQLLLSAHPEGMVVGEIQYELDIPTSTLSHHLDKLKNERLGQRAARRARISGTRQTPKRSRNSCGFLYAECCTRNKAVEPAGHRATAANEESSP